MHTTFTHRIKKKKKKSDHKNSLEQIYFSKKKINQDNYFSLIIYQVFFLVQLLALLFHSILFIKTSRNALF